jgi:hypothetical protein
MVEIIVGLVVLGVLLYVLLYTTYLTSLAVFLLFCAGLGCGGLWFCKTYTW